MKAPNYRPRMAGYQEKEWLAVLHEDAADQSRKEMLAFIGQTKSDFEINWHHAVLATALDQFYERKIKNLMVFMPPRVGKTESVSRRFPAYTHGRSVDARLIATSYSDALASATNRDVQRIIDSDEYRAIFPATTLSGENVRSNVTGSWLRNNDIFEIVGHRGFYKSAGIGSGITGLGFDYGIIDDPIKNWQEALSPTVRQKHWDWYTSTFYTRREKNAGICLVMTRWHEDDLAGRIINQAKETGEEWTVVSFPMIKEGPKVKSGYESFLNPEFQRMDIREEGEPLWPGKYSIQECDSIKLAVGSRIWAGLYQQRPAPAGGSLVKRDWVKFYRAIPDEALRFGEWLQSWDLSFKGNDDSDHVVGQVWVKYKAKKYLVHQTRAKLTFTETIIAIKTTSGKYPHVVLKLIEDKANGPAVISALQKEVSGIVGVNVSDSKIARLNAVAPEFEAGNIELPDPTIAPWIHDYIEELVTFPQGAHDDQVDATTQALLRFQGNYTGDFSTDLIPKSNKTISGQTKRGSKW